MNFRMIIIAILCLITGYGMAQSITGKVRAQNGTPLQYVSVKLYNTEYQTLSDDAGDYHLTVARPGNYTLVAELAEYHLFHAEVTVGAASVTLLNIQLIPNQMQLEGVEVVAQRQSADRASNNAARLPLANLENPQVVNTVTDQLITRQGLNDIPTIVRNIPGVTRSWASVSSYYSIRGFLTRTYFRNGLSNYVAANLDPVNLQQLDVIKGPSGTLFGGALTSFGAVINRVTKKPHDTQEIEAGYQGGSYNASRFMVDANLPLNANKTTLFRITAAHQYKGSFQDAGFLKSTFVAPSLTYHVNDRLTLNLEAEIFSREGTSEPQFFPTSGNTGNGAPDHPEALHVGYKKSYMNNTVTLVDPTQSFYGKITYQLSDRWKMETNLVSGWTSNTGNYLTFGLPAGDSLLIRRVSNYPDSHIATQQIQQNFTGDFQTGPVHHRLVAGLDYYHYADESASNALNGRSGRPTYDTLSLTSTSTGYASISPALIEEKLAGYDATYNLSKQNIYSAYVSDVINPITPLAVMISGRLDYFDNLGTTNLDTDVTSGAYHQVSFSPKLGVVYQLKPQQLSAFVNYMSGFQNVAPVTQPDATVSNFKPQYGNQLEGGFKAALFDERLTGSISYYNIQVTNVVRADPNDATYKIQDGKQYSRGLEVELQSEPVTGMFIKAGYAYNQSKLTASEAATTGRRPVNSGPAHTAIGYMSYRLSQGKAQGLGVGLGGNYYGKTLLINSSTSGVFYVKAYSRFYLNVFLEQPHYRVGLNVDNLANTHYYYGGAGSFTPGMLRSFTLNLSTKF